MSMNNVLWYTTFQEQPQKTGFKLEQRQKKAREQLF